MTKAEWMKRDVDHMMERITKPFRPIEYCDCGVERRLTKIYVRGVEKYKCVKCEKRWKL